MRRCFLCFCLLAAAGSTAAWTQNLTFQAEALRDLKGVKAVVSLQAGSEEGFIPKTMSQEQLQAEFERKLHRAGISAREPNPTLIVFVQARHTTGNIFSVSARINLYQSVVRIRDIGQVIRQYLKKSPATQKVGLRDFGSEILTPILDSRISAITWSDSAAGLFSDAALEEGIWKLVDQLTGSFIESYREANPR